jgi:hypothetical protein
MGHPLLEWRTQKSPKVGHPPTIRLRDLYYETLLVRDELAMFKVAS